MKYLIVLLVVVGGLWLLFKRHGRSVRDAAPPRDAPAQAMLRCAHCGLHLPAADAVLEGSSVYCCDAHRRLGPGPAP